MSNSDAPHRTPLTTPPPLSWPPPGLERLQGGLWRVIALGWIGSLVLVLPLLWALAVEQPFYSLGPFEDNWQLGLGISILGATIVVVAFWLFFGILRGAAYASDIGYGALTIMEVATDSRRDTGFLIQGKRHFAALDSAGLIRVVKARLRGAGLVLAGALWLVVGFGLAILLAARGFVTPSGIWLMTWGPTGLMTVLGLVLLVGQNSTVRAARNAWQAQEGSDRVRAESVAWSATLEEASDAVVLGAGPTEEGGRFRTGAAALVVLFVIALLPTMTISATTAIGPILAEIAVPSFQPVQEAAGGAEALRRYRLAQDPAISSVDAGAALQNLAFVGGPPTPEPMERRPATAYEEPWFPDPDYFPDPFSESVAADLVSQPLASFSDEERAALMQAAAHPAQEEFELLARAPLVDIVGGRWRLPFPDSTTFQDLWTRFPAIRTAGLARVAKATVELSQGQPQQAETTLRELISTGFLLIDQGPTMVDNLMGVVLTDIGGDALEAYYRRNGQDVLADELAWARSSALGAARRARAGLIPEDIHSLLQGIPDLVETEDALRGLRWEYFATFNTLAPCINLHKMVFGPDETYEAWRERVRDALVRSEGERELFALAERGTVGAGVGQLQGFFPRFLSLTLGSGGAPGSCASLIASLQG